MNFEMTKYVTQNDLKFQLNLRDVIQPAINLFFFEKKLFTFVATNDLRNCLWLKF